MAPSIDVEGGVAVKRVRGVRGTGLRLGDPSRLVEAVAALGFRWVHIVDLTAAATGRLQQPTLELVRLASREHGLRVQYGGGVRSLEAGEALCSAGAERLVVGTAWLERPGFPGALAGATGCQVLAAVEEDSQGRILSRGWERREPLTLTEALEALESTGAQGVLYTQTWREGTMQGPDVARVELVRAAVRGILAYAGGVSSPRDLEALQAVGVDVAVVGMALYTGGIPWGVAAGYA